MNDISVLFPLATTSQDFAAYLSADASGRGGSLLPDGLYSDPNVPQSPDMAYESLRAVSFRLDPCFANLGRITNPATCLSQLRVIFQPLSFSAGATTAFDGAVHAFYALTAADFNAMVQAVQALREKNGGSDDLGPLAVHPILASQGVSGALGQGLTALIRQYAGVSNLVRFTLFRSASLFAPDSCGDSDNRFWNFRGFDVGNGQLTPMVIPTTAGSTTVNFSVTCLNPMAGLFSPSTTSSDNMQLLTDANSAVANPGQAQQAFDAALRIENPNFNSPNTIDCGSCHLAEPARYLVGSLQLGLAVAGDSNAFVPDGRFVSTRDAEATSNVNTTALNLHAFSYRGSEAMINQRVINETAAIIAYLNGRPPIQ